MKLIALTRYGTRGASSRMRLWQYVDLFSRHGIDTEVRPLFSDEDLARRYETGAYGTHHILRRYFRRAWALIRRHHADLIWVEKELIPFAPSWFERLLLSHRRYVMDFDDATFHNYDSHRIGLVRKLYGRKIDRLMKHATLVFAGNDYLAERALSAGCPRVEIVPTVIDLDRYPFTVDRPGGDEDELVIGWIGSPSTTKYLKTIEKPLVEISRERKVRLRVIGGTAIDFPGVNVEQVRWCESEEASLLAGCDFGIMPLPDLPWERGKCGYKLIQYMASGRPAIGSPVGVNSSIVTPEVGYLCDTDQQWLEAFRQLASNPDLRKQMGKAGRNAVEREYCIQQTGPIVVKHLKSIVNHQEIASPAQPSSLK